MNIAVVGAQGGDEGKGKIVDLLAERFSIVARYQGGHNAGHTVHVGGRKFILRLIPSGILHPGVTCVIGNGVVVDLKALFDEVGELASAGIDVNGRLLVSDRAHVILGERLREIAGEKAGIFKPGVPAITVPQRADAMERLAQAAAAVGSTLSVAMPHSLLDGEDGLAGKRPGGRILVRLEERASHVDKLLGNLLLEERQRRDFLCNVPARNKQSR